MKLPNIFALTIILSVALLSGCSGASGTESPGHIQSQSVEDAYSDYLKLVESGAEFDRLAEEWDEASRELIYRTPDGSGGVLDPMRLEAVLRYPLLFDASPRAPTVSPFEGGKQCLELKGRSVDGDPLVVQILFAREGGRWLHSELFVISSGDGQALPEYKLCQT